MKNLITKKAFKLSFIAILLVFLVQCLIVSCKKKSDEEVYTCSTCAQTPEAKAANDGSGKGIYKGVVIGSSGTIKFDIANNGNTILAIMVIDGSTVNLSSNVSWVNGQSYTSAFTGTLNGSPVSLTFHVDANGQGATITSSTIPGHPNAVFTLVKESSTALIECFEGTYTSTKPESGTFNLLLSRSLKRYGGIAYANGGSKSDFEGTINGQNQLLDEDGRVLGTLTADAITGTFKDGSSRTVEIKAKRTL